MKKTIQEPKLYCRESVSPSGDTLCTAFFETRSFEELGEQVTGWIAERPGYEIVSLSHSTGGRWEKNSEKVSWGKVEPVNIYTALLLFRPANRAA